VKVRMEIIDGISEDEVLIRCGRVDGTIQKIHQYLLEQSLPGSKITFFKQNREFYFPLESVLFFETEGEHIYAHTVDDAYRVKYRLYELENMLPSYFVRASKSVIVNMMRVYSVARNLASSSQVQFMNSHKLVYVSRRYYHDLRQRLNERSGYET